MAGAVFASRHGSALSWLLVVLAALGAAALGSNSRMHWWLAGPVGLFCALVVAATLLMPNYNSAGIYHPAIMAAGFLALWRADASQRRLALGAAWLVGAGLAIWGIAQVITGQEGRASAYFESANTLAGFLAMLALPAFFSLAARPAIDLRVVLLAVLAAGVFAAQSRGAAVAFAAGAVAGSAFAWVGGARLRWRGMAIACIATMAGGLIFLGAAGAPRATPASGAQTPPVLVSLERRESLDSRLELYRASIGAWRTSPVLGTGYLTFPYVLEAARAEVPSYDDAAATFFVHNDYLQTLQELGMVGLAVLLAMLAAPFVVFLRMRKRWTADAALGSSICLGAIAAMAAHALVDFPFYVPATLFVFGALLGAFNRIAAEMEGPPPPAAARRFGGFLVRAFTVTAVACLLLPPAIAQACDHLAVRAAREQDVRQALYWFKVASNFQPADARYRWLLGRMWTDQALITGKKEFAALAEKEFRAGVEANPRDLHNLLGLIQLHRRASELVAEPASAQQLSEWSRQALRLAPRHTAARRERVLVLVHLDRWQDAREEAERWVRDEPQNPIAARLVERLTRKSWPRSAL